MSRGGRDAPDPAKPVDPQRKHAPRDGVMAAWKATLQGGKKKPHARMAWSIEFLQQSVSEDDRPV
jgi:hypothetical protein